MKPLCHLLVLMLSIQFSNGFQINEIMYNPEGEDNNKEFIEIFSNQAINLSGYLISDGDSNNTLGFFYLNDCSNYSLIVEDDSIISTNNASVYKIGAAIGNGLSAEDVVSIYSPDGNLMDSVKINSSIANGNGHSISYYNGSWAESRQINGTPGYENSISQEITVPEEAENIVLEAYISEILYTRINYTQLFRIKIENKANCSEKDNVTVFYNITHPGILTYGKFAKEIGCSTYSSTGEFTPKNPGNYTLCGTVNGSTVNESYFADNIICANFTVIDTSILPCNISINVTTNETGVYEEGQPIKFRTELNNETSPFIIQYWIEDIFGNFCKDPYNTTNTNQKSWKTSIAEQDRVLFVKSIVYPGCNDSDLSDNFAEKMFIVKSGSSDSEAASDESILEIAGLDDKVNFGDTVDVKVSIYKGDTSKYSISLWAEDSGKKISETTKINLYDKYSHFNGQLPVKLYPNCDLRLEEGEYDVVLSGMGKEDKKEIDVQGIKSSECPASSEVSSPAKSSKKFDFELIDFPDSIEVGKEFTAKVMLSNNDDEDTRIKLWSYVYRGSKCYSGEREQNLKELVLKANSFELIQLNNIIREAEPGSYKFKVIVNRNNQKTNNEITEVIAISDYDTTKNENIDLKNTNKNDIIGPQLTDEVFGSEITSNAVKNYDVVYESTTEKAKKLIYAFMIIASILLNVVLIWKR
jgi:hypothetical protein